MYSDLANETMANPAYIGPMEGATHEGVAGAPGDGPYMLIWLEAADNRILRAAFKTFGCHAAVACGSITAALVTRRTFEQAAKLEAADLLMIAAGIPEGKQYCADLAIQALRAAIGS